MPVSLTRAGKRQASGAGFVDLRLIQIRGKNFLFYSTFNRVCQCVWVCLGILSRIATSGVCFHFHFLRDGECLDRIISLEGGFWNFALIGSSSCAEVNSFYWIQIRENKKIDRLLYHAGDPDE